MSSHYLNAINMYNVTNIYKTAIQFVFCVEIKCATKLFMFKNVIFAIDIKYA